MKINQTSHFDRLWINAHLAWINADDTLSILQNGAIAIKNNHIVWVGLTQDIPQHDLQYTPYIYNCQKQWILPGFIDCHTHLVYAGNRCLEAEMRSQGKSYTDIAAAGGGILSSVTKTRAASEKSLIKTSQKRLHNLLREGVTALEIKSGYGLDLDSELKMLRVADKLATKNHVHIQETLLSAHAIPPEFKNRSDDYVDYICETILPTAASLNIVDAVDVFCESIGFTTAQCEKIFQAATALHLPVKMHAEQLSNQGGSLLAAQYHALSVDHLEYLDEKSIQALAQSKTVAVLLPGAFYYLRETQKPPIHLLRQYKIPMAIATDTNPGTSPIPSILFMMQMASTLFGLTCDEILSAVTKHAARALGLQNTHGDLAIGKLANFCLWDIEHPRGLIYEVQHYRCKMMVRQGNIYRSR